MGFRGGSKPIDENRCINVGQSIYDLLKNQHAFVIEKKLDRLKKVWEG